MPAQTTKATKEELFQVELPQHGGRYTTVSHKSVVDESTTQLTGNSFKVIEEDYIKNFSGEVAQGIYHLDYGTDPEIGMMFTWGNSYDKSRRFECAVGTYVIASGNRMIAGNINNFAKKHMGKINEEIKEHIKSQVSGAINYYNMLVKDKNIMKTIEITKEQFGQLLGTLYLNDHITVSQVAVVKNEYEDPQHTYGVNPLNLWAVYNYVATSLKKSHPKNWVEQQKELHSAVKSMFFHLAPPAPEVDENQVDLIDSIEEIEAEKAQAEVNFESTTDHTPKIMIDEEATTVDPELYEEIMPTASSEPVDVIITSTPEPVEETIVSTPEPAEEVIEESAPSFDLGDYAKENDVDLKEPEPVVEEPTPEPEVEPEPEIDPMSLDVYDADPAGEEPLPPVEEEEIVEETSQEAVEAAVEAVQDTGVAVEQATESAISAMNEAIDSQDIDFKEEDGTEGEESPKFLF